MSFNPRDPALLRRVEEASLNSWPAPRQTLLDGWVLRFADGYTRRANSVTPLDTPQDSPETLVAKIAACETLYSDQGHSALIRVRSFDQAELTATLGSRGYAPEGLSRVLWMPLDVTARLHETDESVELSEKEPGPDWLQTHTRLSGCDVVARSRVLGALAVPCAFAGARVDGPSSPFSSIAFAAVHNHITCLHLVATDPAFRRRGLSHSVISALLTWARRRVQAREASLQVAAENASALALYKNLGFRTELFSYQYYRQPDI